MERDSNAVSPGCPTGYLRGVKLRLNQDSIRFRLRQGDVQKLMAEGRLESAVALDDAAFGFALQLHEGPATAGLAGGRLLVCVPLIEAREWATTDRVSLSLSLATGTRLLVEKDFACHEPHPGETNEGTFPRPAAERLACPAS